jgi:hypothetical protein
VSEGAEHKLRSFLVELAIYAGLVVGYFYAVLSLLGDWLKVLYDENKTAYAFAALGLIIGQGVVLETVTSALLRLIKSRLP